jgi:hypothetical protein
MTEKVHKLHVISSCVDNFGGVHMDRTKPFTSDDLVLRLNPGDIVDLTEEDRETDLVEPVESIEVEPFEVSYAEEFLEF